MHSSSLRNNELRIFNYYTDLNMSREHIYVAEGVRLNFRRPNPIKKDRSKRDPRKFYRYHCDIGHDTNECFDLNEEIEDLIHRRHLA